MIKRTCAGWAVILPSAPGLTPKRRRRAWKTFRETYRELIEINTTLSAGDCTAAARRWPSG